MIGCCNSSCYFVAACCHDVCCRRPNRGHQRPDSEWPVVQGNHSGDKREVSAGGENGLFGSPMFTLNNYSVIILRNCSVEIHTDEGRPIECMWFWIYRIQHSACYIIYTATIAIGCLLGQTVILSDNNL